jgi:ParB family chromosome partitioning protein
LKNLNPIEEARAFQDYVTNYGWGGISELAIKLGKSVSYVDKRIRLLDLPTDGVDSLSAGSLSVSIGDELLPLKKKEQQSKIAELIKKRKLSSRQVQELKSEMKSSDNLYDVLDFQTKIINIDAKTQKSFDKVIIAIRVAEQIGFSY